VRTIARIILFLILAFLLLVLCNACVTYQKCVDKYGKKDTVRVTMTMIVHDTVTIVTPADTIRDHVNIDSLFALVDTLRHTSASGRLQLKLWKDKYTRQLHYIASLRADTITVIERDTVRVVGDCPPGVVFVENKDVSGLRALWLKYQLFAAWALLVLLFVLVFLKRIKSLFQ
jgi:hypothetical protein